MFRMTFSGTPPVATITILHSFGSVSEDGAVCRQGLVLGPDGTLYGTTISGGTADAGVAFKITSPASASPQYSIVHNFSDGSVSSDGAEPETGLILGSDGNFYGTTTFSGSGGGGTVFQMTPSGAITILHNFLLDNVDGVYPKARLFESGGYLYGTTSAGGSGSSHSGTIFKLPLPTPATTTDTPPMPFWALASLALFLILIAARSLPGRRSS